MSVAADAVKMLHETIGMEFDESVLEALITNVPDIETPEKACLIVAQMLGSDNERDWLKLKMPTLFYPRINNQRLKIRYTREAKA